jgi:hypothetical protein
MLLHIPTSLTLEVKEGPLYPQGLASSRKRAMKLQPMTSQRRHVRLEGSSPNLLGLTMTSPFLQACICQPHLPIASGTCHSCRCKDSEALLRICIVCSIFGLHSCCGCDLTSSVHSEIFGRFRVFLTAAKLSKAESLRGGCALKQLASEIFYALYLWGSLSPLDGECIRWPGRSNQNGDAIRGQHLLLYSPYPFLRVGMGLLCRVSRQCSGHYYDSPSTPSQRSPARLPNTVAHAYRNLCACTAPRVDACYGSANL